MVCLEEITIIYAPLERCFDLARSVEVHVLGNTHWGEQAAAIGGVTSGLPCLGDKVTWRARHFGVRFTLTSEITKMNAPDYFQDEMVRGPFRSMQHDHYFRTLESGGTEMKDVFRFAAPVPVVGVMVERLKLRGYMQALLRERNQVIKQVAESEEWRKYLGGGRCES